LDIHFVLPELRHLDRLKSEAISLPFFSDERPLRGTLGLLDWRMCGRISKLILARRIDGARDEITLVPARPRLTFEKVFLFGLGPREAFDAEVYARTTARMLETLTRARVRASALALPGRALGLIDPVSAMESFLRVAAQHPEHDDVTLLEGLDAQKEMAPIVERERRRARAAGVL
jgi:hypothetical protein